MASQIVRPTVDGNKRCSSPFLNKYSFLSDSCEGLRITSGKSKALLLFEKLAPAGSYGHWLTSVRTGDLLGLAAQCEACWFADSKTEETCHANYASNLDRRHVHPVRFKRSQAHCPGRKFYELSKFGGSEKEKFASVWNISSALAFQSAGLGFYASLKPMADATFIKPTGYYMQH
jgi:hypothetical protein